jgi:hypothetical protein
LTAYIVKVSDTLSDIAQRFLHSANRWPELSRLNHLTNPNFLYIGQKLLIPEPSTVSASPASQPGLSPPLGNAIPANVALARGFMFIVFEQLPNIGATAVIRKVAAIPRNFSLAPPNPLGTLSPAEHVLNMNPRASPFLSASNQPFGAPSINGKPLLLDLAKIRAAGGQVYSIEEVVADLRRFAAQNPTAARQVNTVISTIKGVEGEILIRGSAPAGSASTISSPHLSYVRSAEDLWRAFTEGKITRPQLEIELASLSKAYSQARIVGNIGRGLMVIGIVFTAVDLGMAADHSITQRSFKPIAAETIRQVGGWGGAFAGGKIGFGVGALFGIETGPGAIVTGGVGALIFGAAGYFGADWVADKISPN